MNWRRFLGACAAGLGGGCVPRSAPERRQADRPPDVVVVGAGLSGLAAALELTQAGLAVRMLEAAQRPGGRILTIRQPFHDGQSVEAGAAHVVGDPSLLDLCRRMGLRLQQPARARGLMRAVLAGGERVVLAPGAEAPRRVALSAADEKLGFGLFEQAHPGIEPLVTATASHCWTADPLARGAYAYFRVGQLTTLGPALARAEGRLHFAGDHTSHRPGFMHGALAAAQRVVREIAAAS